MEDIEALKVRHSGGFEQCANGEIVGNDQILDIFQK